MCCLSRNANRDDPDFFTLLTGFQTSYSIGLVFISQLYLLLELALLTAVAIAFGVFTSSILATLLSLGVYLMGHVSVDLLKLGQISKNATIESLTSTLYLILPDLERLNLRNDVTYGMLPSINELISNAAYGIIYTALLLAIAIGIFSRRQF